MLNAENAMKKWAPVLDHADAPKFRDSYRKSVTAVLLENQERAMKEERQTLSSLNEGSTNGVGAMTNFDPILISLVRRAMPNLIAFDIAGVQPMQSPTGLIFALKPKYNANQAGNAGVGVQAISAPGVDAASALYGGKFAALQGTATSTTTVNTAAGGAINYTGASGFFPSIGQVVSGTGITTGSVVTGVTVNTFTIDKATTASLAAVTITFAAGLATANISSTFAPPSTTATGEGLVNFAQMGFSIEKSTVTAKTRALKADYTLELAQDLKAVHGLDAESELANILSAEILFEINREIIELVNANAVLGSPSSTVAGTFNMALDADGRWAAERAKGLLMAIEFEANRIAKDTRRGKGNFVVCSSNVASVLSASGALDYAPALKTELNVDDTGNTFAGVLNGRIKVYVDPYAISDYVTVGYRGTNAYDAGLFYCPYVPLTMVRAVDPADFQPKIAFKTRYGITTNPFVDSTGSGAARQNFYYRTFGVTNTQVLHTAPGASV